MVWLHSPREMDRGVVEDLISRLTDEDPDLWFLVTDQNGALGKLPDNCFVDVLPSEEKSDIREFLDHWHPDLLGWMGDSLSPKLIAAASQTAMPMFLLDTGNAMAIANSRRFFRTSGTNALKHFDHLIVGDQATAKALQKSGAPERQISTLGTLDQGIATLHCDEDARTKIARAMGSRPVWLATMTSPDEIELIVAAHKLAMRRSHRLMLIILPETPSQSDAIVDVLAKNSLNFIRRSIGGDPDADIHVYVADTNEKHGLWYRVSPLTFMGQTMRSNSDECVHPFSAAAHGSVVIHGPNTKSHSDAFQRLTRAAASRSIKDEVELATVIDELQAPDKVANIAHAAWEIITAGAEVTDYVVNLITNAMNQKRGSK